MGGRRFFMPSIGETQRPSKKTLIKNGANASLMDDLVTRRLSMLQDRQRSSTKEVKATGTGESVRSSGRLL